ncbi:DUF932 domain-containing protein [Nocardioides luteus]|uniref:DUF932 domain-containing protein n=1 Tax=Nocardioides luteus TaxID=1844 RepID=UPI0018CBEA7B|nr:DUF932 domain-containing protein [Nocardioides luteus]MBG6099067.1 phage/plasmid-like protein (TIGR03299 family) [Nocardioides luteus]
MAHEIETHGRQAAAVFAREDAWHRLGTTLEDVFTAEEAMTIGHLGGWNVRKTPLQGIDLDENGANLVDVPDRFATVRTNPFTGQAEALGVVGTSYAVIQNEEHADTLNQLVEDSGAIFDTAGSLRGGRQVFVSLRLPETMRVGDADEIRTNIVALNSHDGTQAFRLLVTPVRVVCANTQAAAIANHTASVSIRHTTNASIQVARIRDALGLSFRYIEAFEAEAEKMIQQTMTDAAFAGIVEQLYGTHDPLGSRRSRTAAYERTRELERLWGDAATQANIRGTAWAGYQVIVEYVDHYAPVRARHEKATARAARLLTSEEPTRLKERAWDLCAAAS